MPDDGGVSAKLARARAALSKANTSFPSSMAPRSAPAPPPSAPAPKPSGAPMFDYGKDIATGLQDKMNQAKGSYKHGGRIPSTGLYKLHKGEKVITARMANAKRALKKG